MNENNFTGRFYLSLQQEDNVKSIEDVFSNNIGTMQKTIRMWLMLYEQELHNFVVASGETHSVRNRSENQMALKRNRWCGHWSWHVYCTNWNQCELFSVPLLGDGSKAQKELGWAYWTYAKKILWLRVLTWILIRKLLFHSIESTVHSLQRFHIFVIIKLFNFK